MVSNVSEREALSFTGKWKVREVFSHIVVFSYSSVLQVPAVLYLERVDTRDRLNYSNLPDSIDTAILTRDISISPSVL